VEAFRRVLIVFNVWNYCNRWNQRNDWNGPVPVMNGARVLRVAKRSQRKAVERFERLELMEQSKIDRNDCPLGQASYLKPYISTFREFSKRGRVDWLVKTLVRKPSNPVNYGKFRDFEPYPG
jgi:hypothetical protein